MGFIILVNVQPFIEYPPPLQSMNLLSTNMRVFHHIFKNRMLKIFAISRNLILWYVPLVIDLDHIFHDSCTGTGRLGLNALESVK